jgi:hypothetical protein
MSHGSSCSAGGTLKKPTTILIVTFLLKIPASWTPLACQKSSLETKLILKIINLGDATLSENLLGYTIGPQYKARNAKFKVHPERYALIQGVKGVSVQPSPLGRDRSKLRVTVILSIAWL